MSYQEALAGIGVRATLNTHIGDYQGDWAAVVKDDGGYYTSGAVGFLVYGYGSCSGCDEWEAAESAVERAEIVVRMATAIRWFDTVGELKAWLLSDDRQLSFFYPEEGWREFRDLVCAADEFELLGYRK